MKITKIESDDYTIFSTYGSATNFRDNDVVESRIEIGDYIEPGATLYIHDLETDIIHRWNVDAKFIEIK